MSGAEQSSVPGAEAMAVALDLVSRGVLEVRADGTVWKLRNLNATPMGAPRRAEQRAKAGYLMVKACADGRQFLVSAHRLVWTVLRGPIPEGVEPNHEDGNKANNHPDNLELLTRGKNIEHAYRTGLRTRTDMAGDFSDAVKALRAEGLSFSRIATELGISQTTAFRAANTRGLFVEVA